MFATVHKNYLVLSILCALFFTSVLPTVVRSQEDTRVNTATSTPNISDALPVASMENKNPYITEGVPGGSAVIGDFVVGPGKVDLTISPGESKTIEMTVTNRTGERRIFNIKSEDAQGSQDTNNAITLLGDDKGPYSMKDFVHVESKSFELDHGMRARIPVTISIPANADPGGLYGSVLIDTVAINAKEGDSAGAVPQSAIIARIGTLFFITIPGPVTKDGNLKDFNTIPKKLFYQEGPINFGILFDNRGSIHLAPYGELRITNMFGEEVGYLQLDPWFVLPKSLRLREVAWNRDFLFGRYTAKVFINRSYDNKVDEMTYTFWVLPWKPITGAFVGLYLFFFIIRAFFRKFEFKRK